MGNATTISTDGERTVDSATEPSEGLALIVAWSAAEPHRVGEIALLDEGSQSFGRGEPPEGDARWVRFARQRPGANEPTGPIRGPGISREQLQIKVRAGAVLVRRAGRCPMAIDGHEVDEGALLPGDTLLLKNQLLLLCARRPQRLAPARDFPAAAAGAFGEPDASGLLGESPAIWRLREQIGFHARTDAGLLILGPSGGGKELAARAVHALSRRAGGPLVARNAATLPPGLVDAELFGNAKGYPNAGMPERPGLLGQAAGGTLFLDEIGELPQELQAHLLRVLDEGGEYHRLGEGLARRADVRLIAATNRAPDELKHDFLARLPLRLALPGLEPRREDIPLLIRHLLRRATEQNPEIRGRFFAGSEPRVDPRLVDHLVRRAYTTHVRELGALLWRAMASSPGDVVRWSEDLGDAPRPAPLAGGEPTLAEIRAGVDQHEGNLAKAARALGLPSRYALYRLLKTHGIEPDALRRPK